jgi:MFS family permease
VFADRTPGDLHISREWFFAVFSAALLLSGLLGPLAGRVIDKHGGRDVLALTNVIFAAGLVALSFASNLVMLAVAWTECSASACVDGCVDPRLSGAPDGWRRAHSMLTRRLTISDLRTWFARPMARFASG